MSSLATLVGTPDREPHVPMPSPFTCTCIFTASTSGMFGRKMELNKVGDPRCPRHRNPEAPARKPKMLGQRLLVSILDEVSPLTARHKLA